MNQGVRNAHHPPKEEVEGGFQRGRHHDRRQHQLTDNGPHSPANQAGIPTSTDSSPSNSAVRRCSTSFVTEMRPSDATTSQHEQIYQPDQTLVSFRMRTAAATTNERTGTRNTVPSEPVLSTPTVPHAIIYNTLFTKVTQ